MKAKVKTNRRYDREFKLGAVKLVLEQGRSCAEAAEALGTTEQSIRNWIAAYEKDQSDAFPGSGKQTPADAELAQLREEVRVLRMEREILKKTIGLFTERPK